MTEPPVLLTDDVAHRRFRPAHESAALVNGIDAPVSRRSARKLTAAGEVVTVAPRSDESGVGGGVAERP